MRRAGAILAAALVGCEGSQAAGLELSITDGACQGPHCLVSLSGQGLYVSAGEPQGDDPLATEAGQLLFYGEGQTQTGTTVVIEAAFDDLTQVRRVRYREIRDGRVTFRGQASAPTYTIDPLGRRHLNFVVEAPAGSRRVEAEIQPLGELTVDDHGAVESGGCGGEDPREPAILLYWPTPPVRPVPVPDPDPPPPPAPPQSAPSDSGCDDEPAPGPGASSESSGCEGDPGPTSGPDTTSSGCEGDGTSSSSSDSTSSCEGDPGPSSSDSSSSCEGESSGPASSGSSSSCEGDPGPSSSSSADGCESGSSSGSSSSSSSSCEGDSAVACVPVLPLERILATLGRTFGPVSMVGLWNRVRRRRKSPGSGRGDGPELTA